LQIPNGRDIRPNLLRIREGPGLGKQPSNSRILKPLESFALKPTARRLFAPFLFSQLRFPLDHPFAMMLSAGPADSLSVNDDGNGYVGEPRL
jgi:hypothetical protein